MPLSKSAQASFKRFKDAIDCFSWLHTMNIRFTQKTVHPISGDFSLSRVFLEDQLDKSVQKYESFLRDSSSSGEYIMKKHVPYGIMNYAELVGKHAYFVDKTHYIEPLEQIENPVFLRPKRFGKSLWCSILQHYYDLRYAEQFDELFGRTQIGRQPTAIHNQFCRGYAASPDLSRHRPTPS